MLMKFIDTEFPEVKLISSDIFSDLRGCFFGVYEKDLFSQNGIAENFSQDSISYSEGNVIRGLHFQNPNSQGKLVCPVHGDIYDVVVDIRIGSPNFKKWISLELRSEDGSMLWIPPGFAHGFATLTQNTWLLYKFTNMWDPKGEYVINWKDPDLAIQWPFDDPTMSERDKNAPNIANIEKLPLLQID